MIFMESGKISHNNQWHVIQNYIQSKTENMTNNTQI